MSPGNKLTFSICGFLRIVWLTSEMLFSFSHLFFLSWEIKDKMCQRVINEIFIKSNNNIYPIKKWFLWQLYLISFHSSLYFLLQSLYCLDRNNLAGMSLTEVFVCNYVFYVIYKRCLKKFFLLQYFKDILNKLQY